ncbi:putative gp55 [Mycobacteroides abscessus]|nr:putative gp55 [Mycobacteroides abscessus]
MYNTLSLWKGAEKVAITEGELDAIAPSHAVSVRLGFRVLLHGNGISVKPFLGYQTVYILADGDEAGMQFGQHRGVGPTERTDRCRCQKARTLTTSFSEKDEKH